MGDAQNPTLVPIGRKRSETSIRIPTIRCSESYSRTHWPKTIVDVNTDSHSPMLRILLSCPLAETDRRRQYGFAQPDAQNPTLVPIGRKRSSTSIRIRTARCSESYSRTHLPKPIVDVNTDSDHSMLRILFLDPLCFCLQKLFFPMWSLVRRSEIAPNIFFWGW